ncbi:MAG: hypothetical protein HRT65_03845 [Flavobacteriaceae bacterium]|nr:hypothetical protein [Flavobacteriaceae bacterium]
MNKIMVLVLVLIGFAKAHGQVDLTWSDFADITYEPEYNEKYDVHFLKPNFGKRIKTFNGKKIRITGYFLDITGSGEIFLISANPMATCFFCGAAGPESIIEVDFKDFPSFKTDQVIRATGILELNRDDVDQMTYILRQASAKLIQ